MRAEAPPLEALARLVLEIDESVKDPVSVALILEVLGLTDEEAMKLGYRDVFDLAKAVYNIVVSYSIPDSPPRLAEERPKPSFKLALSGLLYGVPWILAPLALIVLGLPLWYAPKVSAQAYPAVIFANLLSLVASNGLTTLLVRRMLFYLSQGLSRVAFSLLKKYYLYSPLYLLSTTPLYLLVMSASVNSYHVLTLGAFLYLAFSFLWLSLAPVYALGKYHVVAALYVAFTAGLAASLMLGLVKLSLLLEGVGAIVLSVSFSLYTLTYFYMRLKIGLPPRPPLNLKITKILMEGLPYYFAGMLYFALVVLDRALVYLLDPNIYLTYESSADASLVAMALGYAVLNYLTHRLSYGLNRLSEGLEIRDYEVYVNRAVREYLLSIIRTLLGGLTSWGLLVFFLAMIKTPFIDRGLVMMYSLGNLALLLYLFNSSIISLVNRPVYLVTSLSLSITLHLFASLLLIRPLGFYGPLIGYLASSVALALVTTCASFRIMKEYVSYMLSSI